MAFLAGDQNGALEFAYILILKQTTEVYDEILLNPEQFKTDLTMFFIYFWQFRFQYVLSS